METTSSDPGRIRVEFCGEWYEPSAGNAFKIGREGDLAIDDNPYLHRTFLELALTDRFWWLANVGSRLSATVTDSAGFVQAWLAPGARLPVVFAETCILFSAGPTSYEVRVVTDRPPFAANRLDHRSLESSAATTLGPVVLTTSQRQLLVALAEPILRRDGTGSSAIPTSSTAAHRLGWSITTFNRKLDNVCDKFDRHGVSGLRGRPGQLAVNRRARLVEFAVASRLVTAEDLDILERSGDDLAHGARRE